MIRLSPFALAGALIATGISVLAASPMEAAARRVQYGDLDLGSSAGRATVDQRIRNAANSVCFQENRALSLAAACSRISIEHAHADLDHALRARQVQLAAR